MEQIRHDLLQASPVVVCPVNSSISFANSSTSLVSNTTSFSSASPSISCEPPFSLRKIHWNPKTKTVIYRTRRSWRTKRNFEVFKATMKVVDTFFRAGEIEFFLRLHGLREGIIDIPPPPAPPFDIETFEPIEPPWQAIREWIPDDDAEPGGDLFDQRPDSGKPVEIPREDGCILVLDSD